MGFEDVTATEYTFPDGINVLVGTWENVLGGHIVCGKQCKFIWPPTEPGQPFFCGKFNQIIPEDAAVNGDCFESIRKDIFLKGKQKQEGEVDG